MPDKKAKKKSAGPRKRRKLSGKSTGLTAREVLSTTPPNSVAELQEAIDRDGGQVLTTYREPFGDHWLIIAALPIDQVEPTPYQRNLSDAHARKLESVIAIVVPEAATAYQILALNTEKAHNLRERALEVIRMYQELATLDDASEESYALEFEEAALITLGLCYLENGRFSGGAYHPILRRSDQFLKKSLVSAIETRRARAKALMDLDKTVIEKVEALKAKGLTSPYLKSFVVTRINPIRFRPKDAAPLSFDEVMERMTIAAEKMNVDKIKVDDLAKSGGAPAEE